jgi:hypothetical protein
LNPAKNNARLGQSDAHQEQQRFSREIYSSKTKALGDFRNALIWSQQMPWPAAIPSLCSRFRSLF